MKKTLFSIVICTHNRAELAQAAIQSVLQQDFPADLYELLIVDNASTDETAQMVQAFCERYPHARYVFEPKIGLSNARNRGWQEGRGEYIGYLDDDAKAGPHWLATAHQVAETLRPLAFGGPYYPFYHSQKPAWFKDEYGSHTFGDQPRFLNTNGSPAAICSFGVRSSRNKAASILIWA